MPPGPRQGGTLPPIALPQGAEDERSDRDHPARTARRVARNTAHLTVSDAAGKLLMFVFFVVAARHLGVERFGLLSFALAYVAMFAVFAEFGLGAVVAREIARDDRAVRRLVNNALTIKLLASALLMAAASLSVIALRYPPRTVAVTAISSCYILVSAVALLYHFVFQGFEKTVFAAVARVLQTVVLTVGAVMLARGTASVIGYAWLYVVAGAVGALTAWIIASGAFVRPGLGFDLSVWGSLLRRSLPIGLASVFAMLYYWNGSALLSRMNGDAAVGLYNAPFRLVMGLGFLAQGFSGAVYPVMSRLHLSDHARLHEVFARSFRYIAMLAVGFIVIGSCLARPAILLLYGADYVGSVPVMAVLVWWGGFTSLNALLSLSLYAVDRPQVVAVQAAVALVLSVGLNLLMIPRYGASGVAVAIVVAEAAGFGWLMAALSTGVFARAWRRALRSLPRVLAAAVVAGGAGLLIARWNVLAGVSVGVAGYPLLLFGLRALVRDDAELLRLVLSREDDH
ncbi:MAG: flippase [bacterium]